MVENQWNASSRNYYVSQSILASAISVATDILIVESISSVYSSISNAAAFSAIRGNIFNGCLWFRDTHAVTTFSSNQNQTPLQSLLQAWQEKSSTSRPTNQGLLICSTAFELKSSTTCMPFPRMMQNHLAAQPHTTLVCEAHLIPDTIKLYLVHISDPKPFQFQCVKNMNRTRLSVPCERVGRAMWGGWVFDVVVTP
jgi:hypothetical protein